MRPYVAYISHYILINHHFSSFFSSSTFAADFSAILWRRAQAASSVLPLACAPFCASHIRAGMASSKSACQNPMANLGWSWLNSENLGWLGWEFWDFTNEINSWLALVDPHVGIEPTRKWMCSSQVDMPLLDSTVVELSQRSWFISPSKHAWSTHAHIIPFQWRGLNLGHFWACICSILPCPSWGTQQVVKSDCRVAMHDRGYPQSLPLISLKYNGKNLQHTNSLLSKSAANFSANGPSQPTTWSPASTAASSLLVSKSSACRSTTRRARRHSAQKCWKHVGIEKNVECQTQN